MPSEPRLATVGAVDGEVWDTVVVGAGPAGCAAAAARLAGDPRARVLIVDKVDLPRDKACGDGIAAEAIELLGVLGFDVPRLVDGYPSLRRLRLRSPAGHVADRAMRHDVQVIPREVFDHRLLRDVLDRGAAFRRHVVRTIDVEPDGVVLDGRLRARTVVGADGAESVVRRELQLAPNPVGRVALAIRGYAPVLPGQRGTQLITMTEHNWPAYAWSFPIGDGRANVGYGELLGRRTITRAELIARMHVLLPTLTKQPERLRAHRLPLSTYRPPIRPGRILLAGDAQSLINPLTGEGIYYAVRSGALAGQAAARGSDAGAAYGRSMRGGLGRHLRHTSALARMSRWPRLIDAGVRGAAADQPVFDDLVRFGLADGLITPRMVLALRR